MNQPPPPPPPPSTPPPPPPPPPPPAPAPGVPPFQPGQAPKTEGLATASLILGLLSIVCLGCLAGVPALICGHVARGRIAKSNGTLSGAGMALTGLILGYLSLVITIVVTIFYIGVAAKQVPKLQSAAAPAMVTAQAEQLGKALQEYKAAYGKLPELDPLGAPGEKPTVSAGKSIADALGGKKHSQSEIVDTGALVGILNGKNPNGTVFYKPGVNGAQVNGLPVDMWLQPLHIAIDLDGDGNVQVGEQKVPGIVAVWSSGPDKKDDHGTGDDVKSW